MIFEYFNYTSSELKSADIKIINKRNSIDITFEIDRDNYVIPIQKKRAISIARSIIKELEDKDDNRE
jgi:hypothetical protein